MNHTTTFDATIPVLTEVFQDEPVKDEPAPAVEAQAAVVPADGTVAELGNRLSERILAQLEERVGAALEQRLRPSIEEAIQAAIAGATDEIRSSLQQIVADAVGEEMARLQAIR
jgi:hypothetical protein